MNKLILAYNKLKKEFDKVLHDETLNKYIILSKAYKLGIKIHGRNSFSIIKLSEDFDIPTTTCKRIMSLDRANKRTWEFIKQKKISSFKVAQICLTKNLTFQDEIVDAVIEDNISTYKISKYRKARSLNDVKSIRLKNAIEKKFARSSTLYTSFIHYIKQLSKFLNMNTINLPKEKVSLLITDLTNLNIEIKSYLSKLKEQELK